MAAELEKLAHDLQKKGYEVGARRLRRFTQSLDKQNLLPPSLENVGKPLLSQELQDLNMGQTKELLRSRGLPFGVAQALWRAGVDGAMLACATDDDLLAVKRLGPKGLKQLRKVFPLQEEQVT